MRRLFLTAAALLFSACPAPVYAAKVLMVGDSITFGIVSGGGEPFVSHLEAMRPDLDIVNVGCGGATAGNFLPNQGPLPCLGRNGNQPLDYWDDLVMPNIEGLDQVFIEFGTNETLLNVSPSWYRAILSLVIVSLIDEGVSDIVLSPPPPVFASTSEQFSNWLGYVGAITHPSTGLCATFAEVTCGPNLATLLTTDDFEGLDVHPNAAGHLKIAHGLAPHAVPEPSTLFMLGVGIAALVYVGRRK